MLFVLGNYSGKILGDLIENSESCSLSTERDKRVTGFNCLRLYSLSKSLDYSEDGMSGDEL